MRGEVLPFYCPISHTFTLELHLPHAAVIGVVTVLSCIPLAIAMTPEVLDMI
jgi:hypothetical protein